MRTTHRAPRPREVEADLHVHPARVDLGDRLGHARGGVVDENVQASPALAVAGHDALDLVLFVQVGGDVMDLRAARAAIRSI